MTKDARVIPFQAGGKRRRCPICGRPTDEKLRPFCSSRCADADLGRWLDGAYRIPTDERPTSADDQADDAD